MLNTDQTSGAATAVLVVMGLDGSDKPHAARFATEHSEVAIRAAGMMKLHAVTVSEPELIDAAGKLPEGKIFATGRGLVPFVKRDLYDRFVPLLGTPAEHPLIIEETAPPPEPEAPPEQTGPSPWDAIVVGSTVLAHSARDGGLYEAVVASVSDDKTSLTLRWRDYASEPAVTVKRRRVGRLAN